MLNALHLCLLTALPSGSTLQEVPASVFDGFGISRPGGELVGAGPRYRIHFDQGAVRYVPALGRVAPKSMPLALEFEEARLGDTPFFRSNGSALADEGGSVVEYAHSQDLVERYEVRADGVALSFVFDALPQTDGDLVVSMSLSTELPLASSDPLDGLRFVDPQVGGVTVGGVTGIDATGASVRGWIERKGDQLELGLPASFVATAELPLVLDPLIGTEFNVSSGSIDIDPDVAWNSVVSAYMVVWTRVFSAADLSVYGQRLTDHGATMGGLMDINGSAEDPAVGALADPVDPKFIVATRTDIPGIEQINYQVFEADTGQQNAGIVPAFSADFGPPDISTGTSFCHILWEVEGVGIDGVRVGLAGYDTYTLVTDPDAVSPSLDGSSSTQGSVFATWVRSVGAATDAVVLAQWDESGVPGLGHDIAFVPTASNPVCAARSGNDCFVVWTDAQGYSGQRAHFEVPGAPSLDGVIPVATGPGHSARPAICYAVNEYILSYARFSGLTFTYFAQPIDCMTGAHLEQELAMGQVPSIQGMAIASGGTSPSSTTDDALAVWATNEVTGIELHAQLIEGIGGSSTSINGVGCSGLGGGTVGNARVSAATAGNPAFRMELSGAAPLAGVIAVVSWFEFNLPLGPATVVPDPFHAVEFAAATDSLGYAGVTTPLPAALAGVQLWLQWAVLPNAWQECTPFSVDLSNAREITIE